MVFIREVSTPYWCLLLHALSFMLMYLYTWSASLESGTACPGSRISSPRSRCG
jgi:hypothetical protein